MLQVFVTVSLFSDAKKEASGYAKVKIKSMEKWTNV
jgi:hypothetical protein